MIPNEDPIEELLQRLPQWKMPPALDQKILAKVRQQLPKVSKKQLSYAAVAAAVLLAINLAFYFSNFGSNQNMAPTQMNYSFSSDSFIAPDYE